MSKKLFRFKPSVAVAFALVATCSTLPIVASGTAEASAVSHGTVQIVKGGPRFADSQSSNWSGYNLGYLSTGTKYFEVTGTWIVPAAKAHKAGQVEHGATWIGIGGGCLNTSCTETDDTLIQAGTSETVGKTGGARYSAWYELIPATETPEKITIHPGDHIHCFIESTGANEWSIQLKDETDGQGFVENTAYTSSELTAEWIVETPAVVSTKGGAGLASLPNLGVVRFFGSKVNEENTAGLVPADAVQLINSKNKPISTPSDPNAKGTKFDVCTWASTCTS
jgi:Peptidase A4 family